MTEKYTVVNERGYTITTGTAREVIDHILNIDDDVGGLGIGKKPVAYWKTGLSEKAAKI